MSGHQLQPEKPPQPLYHDGLEVMPNPPDSAPECISGGYEDPVCEKIAVEGSDGDKNVESSPGAAATTSAATQARPWWKGNPVLLGIATAVLLSVISLGVGLGVGLSAKIKASGDAAPEEGDSDDSDDSGESKGPDPPGDSTGPPPSCNDSICPQIISAVQHQSSLLVFARTVQNTIAYRNYTDS